jgi:hypothetical protein
MSDAPAPDIEQQLATLKVRMTKALKGFSNGYPEGARDREMTSYSPDRKLFPVPELVLFGLSTIMGFRASGPWEKVRWTIFATVAGEPFGFTLQKFGFRILAPRDAPPELLARVLEPDGDIESYADILPGLVPELAARYSLLVGKGRLGLVSPSPFGDGSSGLGFVPEIPATNDGRPRAPACSSV